jgi:peptide/nickel transport system permease protein
MTTRHLRPLRRFAQQPLAVAALAVVVGIFVAGALASVIAPQGWNDLDLRPVWQNHAPTFAAGHVLGTDNIGRDVLVRTLYGIRSTERDALLAALLATAVGLVVGCLAGLRGGWIDALLMRLGDLVTSFPTLMLLYAAYIFVEPVTLAKTTVIFGLYLWTYVARAVRAHIAALGANEFVDAARALGATDLQLLRRHLLPNAAGTAIAAATSLVGQIVLLEATLEFFGLGVPSQIEPSLGNLIGDAAASGIGAFNQLGLGWWVWVAPAVVLAAIVICVNLVGDGLDAALNPTLEVGS